MRRLPIVVLASGRGSNLQSLIDHGRRGALPVEIRAVISDNPAAEALARAQATGIGTAVVERGGFRNRDEFDAALMRTIDRHAPDLVVLAGFMRILGSAFIARFHGRLLNIHPSLLPAFPGLDTHTRALAAGVREHGASVHFVTDEVDGGPVVVQAKVPVLAGDTPQTLASRVLVEEHRILPLAVGWFAQGRLVCRDGAAWLDGRRLDTPESYRASA